MLAAACVLKDDADMGGADTMKFDFSLVTTYLPIVSLCARACVLVVVLYVAMYTIRLPFSAVLMLAACIVFLDVWWSRQSLFDMTCGHLLLCALAITTRPQQVLACSDSVQIALWVVDFVWCLASSFEICSIAWNLQVRVPVICKVLLAQAFAMSHVLLVCGETARVSMLEMLVRVLLYYVFASILILSAPFMPGMDRSHCSICIPVMSVHFLFAHPYPLAGSMLVFILVHTRLLYCAFKGNDTGDREEFEEEAMRGHKGTPSKTSPDARQQEQLLAMLQAAKAAHGKNSL